ncbi:hypothetical protein V6N12_007351 [Hibiscus sabdariffa]|uniref:Uncharacterized protein n=1 Tax=Hibiscus sabdariffa TaxID=183260 RepID=A0ABR2F1H4_9ROSI
MMEALRVTKEQGNSPIYKIRKDVLNERSPQIEAREVLLDNSPRVGAPNLDSVEVQYGNPQFSGLRKCLLSLPSLPKAQLRNSLRKLQVVAEGVAASVFQSSTPSNPDIPATTNESGFEGNQETNVSTRNIEMQHKAKFEEIKTKQPDITNFGFRVSDGIGCLQNCENLVLAPLVLFIMGSGGVLMLQSNESMIDVLRGNLLNKNAWLGSLFSLCIFLYEEDGEK